MSIDVIKQHWDNRYKDGLLWGAEPSQTVLFMKEGLAALNDNVFQAREVLSVGAGYGRDEMYLAANTGVNVTAFEISPKGVKLGKKLAKENKVGDRIDWREQDFTKAIIRKKYDALLSHRTLHLLDDGQVNDFVKKASSSIKPGGLVAISARNFDDFNSAQMEWVDELNGVAQSTIKGRKGHVIHFWNEAKFRKHFGEEFDIPTFHSSTEIESVDNNTETHFTMMIAYKKAATASKAEKQRSSVRKEVKKRVLVGSTKAAQVAFRTMAYR